MKSIINYAKEETRSFKDYPLNEVDSLIFATLAYYNFENDIPSLFSVDKIKIKDLPVKDSYVAMLIEKKKH